MIKYGLKTIATIGALATACATAPEPAEYYNRRKPVERYQSEVTRFEIMGRKGREQGENSNPLKRTNLRLIRPITIYTAPEFENRYQEPNSVSVLDLAGVITASSAIDRKVTLD